MVRFIVLVIVLGAGFLFAMPIHAQTETPIPPTETPTTTPTAMPTPLAAGNYMIQLPSGEVGEVVFIITAGDVMVTVSLMTLATISIFRSLQQLTQSARTK